MTNGLNTFSRISGCSTNGPAASSAKKTFKPSIASQVAARGESLQRLYTPDEVAEMLGVAPATLSWWRSQKRGPNWLRLGRGRRSLIRYRPEAIEAYLAQMESAEL